MNNLELFEKMMKGEIDQRNFKKFKLTKSSFYKVYSRVLFFRKVTDPIKFMVVNLSQREFLAVRNEELKDQVIARSPSKRFPHTAENIPKELD